MGGCVTHGDSAQGVIAKTYPNSMQLPKEVGTESTTAMVINKRPCQKEGGLCVPHLSHVPAGIWRLWDKAHGEGDAGGQGHQGLDRQG